MTIPLTALADKFTDAVWEAMPSADILPLDNVLQAGTTLQRLAQGLAPLVPGGIAIADQDVQHLVSSYVDYSLPPPERRESLTAWSVKRLLEHSPGLHAEELQHLAQDLETITATVRETARQHAAHPLPGASAGESGCAWVSREAQEHGPVSARCR